jgi:hypothetical protein
MRHGEDAPRLVSSTYKHLLRIVTPYCHPLRMSLRTGTGFWCYRAAEPVNCPPRQGAPLGSCWGKVPHDNVHGRSTATARWLAPHPPVERAGVQRVGLRCHPTAPHGANPQHSPCTAPEKELPPSVLRLVRSGRARAASDAWKSPACAVGYLTPLWQPFPGKSHAAG